MKVGAESSKKTWIAIGLAVIAAIMTVRMIIGNFSSSEAAAPTTNTAAKTPPRPPRRPATTHGRSTVKKDQSAPVTPSLDPRLQLALLGETENTEYTGEGRNIFRSQAEDVQIPKVLGSGFKTPPVTPTPEQNTPPPQPPPPPINLKFFGFASQQGLKRVFLSAGDDVIVASEGDIVQRRYKIVKINPSSIEVEDVLNNNRQTIPLSQA